MSEVGESGSIPPCEKAVIIASGPMFKSGKTIEGASILDVTPTILAMKSMPISDDMDGRVLTDVLKMNAASIERIPTYDFEKREEERIKKRLRAMGYL